MNKSFFKRLGLKLVLLAVLVLPELASAQAFNPGLGDVLLGFRKTGTAAGNYELVVNAGNITNFLTLSAGQTINITNYSASQLTNAFTDTGNFANLQWSAFAAGVQASGKNSPGWTTPLGVFPANSIWYTLPSTNVNNQTTPPNRATAASQAYQYGPINGVGTGATTIAGYLNLTNQNNNAYLVREPVSYFNSGNGNTLSCYIADGNAGYLQDNSVLGDFAMGVSVENTTPSPFNSAQRDDFYQSCSSGSGSSFLDPINGQTSGSAYFVGYFILNPNGTMTFTRASVAAVPPVVGSVTSSVTNGFAPLQVVFTNTASSGGTNWIWNFGNGISITNTTSANVTNTYNTGGNFTVTLIVQGAGGSSTNIMSSYITVVAAGFTGTPTNGAAPLQVVFTNTTTGIGALTVTNIWNFGDTHMATNTTSANVTNTYSSAGSYTVTLTVNGASGSSTNQQTAYIVVTNAPPVAGFSGAPTNGLAPLQVVFTNLSTGSFTNSVWNFGNGTTITNLTGGNVTNIYASAGSFQVSLTVNGSGGSSTTNRSNYIVVTNGAPVASFQAITSTNGASTNGFAPFMVGFTNMSTGSFTNSVWNFGNGTIITNLTVGNVTNIYAIVGTNTVTLTVNGLGGSSTNQRINYIVALPTPVLNATNLISANGKLVFSYPNSPAGVQYRILSSTNLTLPVASWTPVFTNTFPNPYTNSSLTNTRAFFRLVSP